MDDDGLEIEEIRDGDWMRLVVRGELDLATVRRFRERIGRVREARAKVRLDLSQAEFIDSSGAHALADALNDSNDAEWRVEVDANVSPEVEHFFGLNRSIGWNFDV